MPDRPTWIRLLDMGPHAYGDAILLDHPGLLVLIDGGYGSLAEDRPGIASIPAQLGAVLEREPPFHLDLLVVTHCHGDHIGCLPRLVETGVLTADWALLAAPDLAFGPWEGLVRSDAPGLALLEMALREEPHDQLPDDRLLEFLDDALGKEAAYRAMIERLAAAGTEVRLYEGGEPSDLEEHFRPRGLTVLGPTAEHLGICSRHLARTLQDGLARADALALPDGALTAADRLRGYREVLRHIQADASFLAPDAPGPGAALNDQSIVLLFETAEAKALLTGDMQLAKPEVPGLEDEMAGLLGRLAEHAPFDLVKVPHHSSYNGLDARVIEALPARIYGHSGGRGSSSHPSRKVLDLLKQRSGHLAWVRTDRNGRVGVRLGAAPELDLELGHQNDFRLPVAADEPPAVAGEPPGEPRPAVGERGPGTPVARATVSGDQIEIVARIPHRATRVVLTVDVQPAADPAVRVATSWSAGGGEGRLPAGPDAGWRLAGGRDLPRLLFATSRALGPAIGSETEARRMLEALRNAGHEVLDTLPSDPDEAPAAAAEVRAYLDRFADPSHVYGVVLLGNYDVVPAAALDVLDQELRSKVTAGDQDRFVVWSDDAYGDRDGDGIPEHAVSRIPHRPGSSDLLWTALAAPGLAEEDPRRFGIRNVHRPFAEDIFRLVPGEETLHVSAPVTRSLLGARDGAGAVCDYLMLHGSALDGTRFWGESADGDDEVIEAFHLDNVPERFRGVVFSGCCWGGLPVERPAGWRAAGEPVRARTPESSIALRYLASGALAFVGCTGTHYSPVEPPYSYFGAPFHQVFWTHVASGYPPALALLETKRLYGASIPHITGSATYTAVELKILQQFTCLGLGW